MLQKAVLAALAAFACASLVTESPIIAASLPCETDPVATLPAAPSGLRILRAGEAIPSATISPISAPSTLSGPTISGGSHAYYETLASRGDCLAAFSMRSQSELDAIKTYAESETKLPVTYDATMDAALIRIKAPVSTDSQQKRFPFQRPLGSVLLTWDFRFDGNFAYRDDGNLARHKTYVIGHGSDGHWIAFKTDYRSGAQSGSGIAELFMSQQSKQWLGPGTTRGEQEILEPRLGTFYVQPDTWTRIHVFVENIDAPFSSVSVWASDERRDPVQLYDRLAVITPPDANSFRLWLEYDSSADQATNPAEMHSWNRNLVVLQNIRPTELSALVQRPVR